MLAGVSCDPGIASLNLIRSQSAEPFDKKAQKLICELIPHLRRTLQIHGRNETIGALFEAGKIALDRLDAAVVVLDGEGRILMASGPAERVLAKNKGMGVHRGKLKATHSSEASRLEKLVCSAAMTARGLSSGAGGALTIYRETGSAPVSVVVTPLGLNCTLGPGRSCALAFLYDPDAKAASRATVLRTLYDLTPAECRLADLLHAGLEIHAAAQQIGVTTGTARFMLKKIFSKTGLHRQAQLVQLLSRLPAEPHGLRHPTPATVGSDRLGSCAD
jgi:DNA-binding CsgD family transcriptional regulator